MSADKPEPVTITLSPAGVGVIVYFEETAYHFDKHGSPVVAANYRTRFILRALLDAAIADLDATS